MLDASSHLARHARQRARVATLLLSVALLAVSASAMAKPLPWTKLPYHSEIPVELHAGQQNLLIEVKSDGGAGAAAAGGVLALVIVGAIEGVAASNDVRRAAPLLQLMDGSDLNAMLLEAFEAGLRSEGVAPGFDIQRYTITRDARRRAKELPSHQRVLSIDLSYSMTYDFSALRVRADVFVGPRFVRGKVIQLSTIRPYRFVVDYLVPLPGFDRKSKEDQRADQWVALGREAIDAMLVEGFAEVAEMTNHSLARLATKPEKGPRTWYRLGRATSFRGQVEHSTNERHWMRTGVGLTSVPH